MDKKEQDILYMNMALNEAKKAAVLGEIPVGAVIVKNGEVIATAHNERETGKNATAHAELLAVQRACEKLGTWRLHGCTLYVTLEPCIMCAGAVINSRINRVVCSLKDPKSGAMGSVLDVNTYPLNHKCEIEYNVLENECRELISDFFKSLRISHIQQK